MEYESDCFQHYILLERQYIKIVSRYMTHVCESLVTGQIRNWQIRNLGFSIVPAVDRVTLWTGVCKDMFRSPQTQH